MGVVHKLKPLTNELHDTLRQIAMSQQPSIKIWRHQCPAYPGNINLEKGMACPYCNTKERGGSV